MPTVRTVPFPLCKSFPCVVNRSDCSTLRWSSIYSTQNDATAIARERERHDLLHSQFDSQIADSDAPSLTPRSRSFGCYFSDERLIPGLFNAEQRSARTGKLSVSIATFAL